MLSYDERQILDELTSQLPYLLIPKADLHTEIRYAPSYKSALLRIADASWEKISHQVDVYASVCNGLLWYYDFMSRYVDTDMTIVSKEDIDELL